MRKYYIDNIRILCILLLFPFHTTMIFNSMGEVFYVNGEPKEILTFVNVGVYAWWMTGLFVLAGMSTMYAFGHRNGKEYLLERVQKLLVPFISGILFVVPMQTYIADRFHNGYSGNYFEHLKIFLTVTDFGGYDGHFTPANLWFILYLFIITVVTLPLMLWYYQRDKKINAKKFTMPVLLLFAIPVALLDEILNVGGKSFAQFGACFLIGFFILSEEEVLERLRKYSTPLGIAWAILIITRCVLLVTGYWDNWFNSIVYRLLAWIGILAMLGLGRRFLDHNRKFTKCFVKAEFPLFLFHQTVIIMVGDWILPRVPNAYVQYILIIAISFILTYLLYQICRRFRITRFLFGIKK